MSGVDLFLKQKFDIIIVSRFGSGHWLAHEWSNKNKVLLLDLSHLMSSWPYEDIEGPFGHSRLDSFSQGYVERLMNDDPLIEQENGWCVWIQGGAFETRGPLTSFQLEKMTKNSPRGSLISKNLLKYISGFYSCIEKKMDSLLDTSEENLASLTAPLFCRHRSRLGQKKNIEWLERQGVVVLSDVQIKDLAWKNQRDWSGLEISSNAYSGLIHGQILVWTLSNSESYFLNEKVSEQIFTKKQVDPEWVWLRYRFAVTDSIELRQVPGQCIMIQDLDLPWFHENFMVIVKTTVADRVDAWVMVPSTHRFQTDYLSLLSKKMLNHLNSRFSLSHFELQELPQETLYTEKHLGPSLHPIWSSAANRQSVIKKIKNVYFDSIDTRNSYGDFAEFETQKVLREKIHNYLEQERIKESKRKQKEL